MSHVATVECKISDLDALEQALEKLGGKLTRNQKKFRYYAGATHPCLHAFGLKDDPAGYEVGLVQAEANTPDVFKFAYDSYGQKLDRAFGSGLVGLQNEYLATVAENQLAARGWMVRRETEGQQILVYGER